jgi:DNA-binding beta-propeller fold protein YncE
VTIDAAPPHDAPVDRGAPATVRHFLFAVNSGPVISVFDIDRAGIPHVEDMVAGSSTESIRGAVAFTDGMLYISYGCTTPQGCTPWLMKYDVLSKSVVWNKTIPLGIDSHSIGADGRTIYMPTGESDYAHSKWLTIDTATGEVAGSIDAGVTAPHNTIVSNDGRHVYMDGVGQDPSGKSYLVVADTTTQAIVGRIGPVLNDVLRPFTVDAMERYAFMLPMGYVGFQVGDLTTGDILYTVPAEGFTCPWMGPGQSITCNHGISLSPDGREIYMVDYYNNRVHVFDVTGLPASVPRLVDSIALVHPYTYGGAWVTHSRDGRLVFVGRSGDVIDTLTRTVTAYVEALGPTKVYTEIDMRDGRVVFTPLSRSGVGYR